MLPGSGNTIQSVTGGVSFTGGWKHKGVKRRPRTHPLCQRSWVIPVWLAWGPAEHPCSAVQVLATVPDHCVAAGSAWCGLKQLLGSLPTAEWSEQGEPCQLHPFYVLGSPCGNLLLLDETAIKRPVRERLSRPKTEAK